MELLDEFKVVVVVVVDDEVEVLKEVVKGSSSISVPRNVILLSEKIFSVFFFQQLTSF